MRRACLLIQVPMVSQELVVLAVAETDCYPDIDLDFPRDVWE